MKRIDKTVVQETKYIAYWILILCAIMHSVFLVIGKWDITVLFGSIFGGASALLNYFLIGLTVQIALEKGDEKDAKSVMKLSQSSRTLFLIVVLVLGFYLSCFNSWATVIPLFFPRIAIAFRQLFNKNNDSEVK